MPTASLSPIDARDLLRRMGGLNDDGGYDTLTPVNLQNDPAARAVRSAQRRQGFARDDLTGRRVANFAPATADERFQQDRDAARRLLAMQGIETPEDYDPHGFQAGATGAKFSPGHALMRTGSPDQLAEMQRRQKASGERRAAEKAENKAAKKGRNLAKIAARDEAEALNQRVNAMIGLSPDAQAAFVLGEWQGPAMQDAAKMERATAKERIDADVRKAEMLAKLQGQQWDAQTAQQAQEHAERIEAMRQQGAAANADRDLERDKLTTQQGLGMLGMLMGAEPGQMRQPIVSGILRSLLPEGLADVPGVGTPAAPAEPRFPGSANPHEENHWIDNVTTADLARMTPDEIAAMATPEQLDEIEEAAGYGWYNPKGYTAADTPEERKWLNRRQMAAEMRRRINAGL